MSDEMRFEKEDMIAGLPESVQSSPVGPMIGISAIALNMAMKYYDINTVQDGALYQQYKLEGKNMHALHLDMVFHTAVQIEQHLISANKRVAKMLVLSALDESPEDADKGAKQECSETSIETGEGTENS